MGKIYGGLLILENWKTTKFGRIPNSQRPVNSNFSLSTKPRNISDPHPFTYLLSDIFTVITSISVSIYHRPMIGTKTVKMAL